MIAKYTVLYEQWREAKEGKSQRPNPRSITRGATLGEKAYFRSPELSAISRIPHFAVQFRRRVLAPFNPANGFPLRVH